MGFIRKLFTRSSREVAIMDYASFWQWFSLHQKEFYAILKGRNDIGQRLLGRLLPALRMLNPGFSCLCGIEKDGCAELIISAEGNIKNFVFAEDLIACAPEIANWRFIALKPAAGLDTIATQMEGYEFSEEKIRFFPRIDPCYPDEISLVFVHEDYHPENAQQIEDGTFVFLENALGEQNLATMIDQIDVAGPEDVQEETIPLNKLLPYLKWREAEFVEKYKGNRYNTDQDRYATFSAQDSRGRSSIGLMNTDLLQWDAKGSHPWMMTIRISYPDYQANGMPDRETFQKMDEFEKDLCELLIDANGYLNIGRQTYNGSRTIYFACTEFRYASRITQMMITDYKHALDVNYDIRRDKYWTTVERFSEVCRSVE